jgi:hypothetical protein
MNVCVCPTLITCEQIFKKLGIKAAPKNYFSLQATISTWGSCELCEVEATLMQLNTGKAWDFVRGGLKRNATDEWPLTDEIWCPSLWIMWEKIALQWKHPQPYTGKQFRLQTPGEKVMAASALFHHQRPLVVRYSYLRAFQGGSLRCTCLWAAFGDSMGMCISAWVTLCDRANRLWQPHSTGLLLNLPLWWIFRKT